MRTITRKMVSANFLKAVTSHNGLRQWPTLGHVRQVRSVPLSYRSPALRSREQRLGKLKAATELKSTEWVPNEGLMSSTVQLPPLTEVRSPVLFSVPQSLVAQLVAKFNCILPRRISQRKYCQSTDSIWSRPRPAQCFQNNGPALHC